MGNVSIVISVAPAIGPTISGLILQFLNWRFMFLIVAPIAIAALIIGAPRLNKNAEASGTPLSIPSVILSVPAFGGLVYGLSKLSSSGLDATTLVVLVIAVLSLVTFVMLQLKLQRKDHALLDMRPFTYRPFTLSLVLMVLAMVALFGVIILLPMYLQNVRGLDTLATGLMLLPGGLLMGLLAPFVGRAYDKVGPRPLVIPGSVILALVLFGYSRLLGAETPIPVIIGLHLTMSLSLALIFTPAFTTALNPLPHSLHSHGSAVLSTLQQLGGAAGTALLVGVLASRISAGAAGRDRPDRRTDLRILRGIHRGCDLRGRHGRRCAVHVQGPGRGTRREGARALANPWQAPPTLMSPDRLVGGHPRVKRQFGLWAGWTRHAQTTTSPVGRPSESSIHPMRLNERTPTHDSTMTTPGTRAASLASMSAMSAGVRSCIMKVKFAAPVVEAHRRSVRCSIRNAATASSEPAGTRANHWTVSG